MSDHSISSSWGRFIATLRRSICAGRAAAERAAAEGAGDADRSNAAERASRVEGNVVERASVAAWEDEGGATKPSS